LEAHVAYDQSVLAAADATDLAWAIAWTRFLLKDTSTTETYSDTELTAVIKAAAFTAEDDTIYYRPHVAAANLVRSDPDRALSEGLLGASITNRDPASVARSIRTSNAWVDDLIESAADERPPSGRTLLAVF
jgi:hypothetical protein